MMRNPADHGADGMIGKKLSEFNSVFHEGMRAYALANNSNKYVADAVRKESIFYDQGTAREVMTAAEDAAHNEDEKRSEAA